MIKFHVASLCATDMLVDIFVYSNGINITHFGYSIVVASVAPPYGHIKLPNSNVIPFKRTKACISTHVEVYSFGRRLSCLLAWRILNVTREWKLSARIELVCMQLPLDHLIDFNAMPHRVLTKINGVRPFSSIFQS